MSQPVRVRDISTLRNGHRVLEVTLVRRGSDDLAVRVILAANAGGEPATSRSSELRLAAALAAEVAEHVADPSTAAIEISVPELPGPAKLTCFPAASHAQR
jgi:hypothetical protein